MVETIEKTQVSTDLVRLDGYTHELKIVLKDKRISEINLINIDPRKGIALKITEYQFDIQEFTGLLVHYFKEIEIL